MTRPPGPILALTGGVGGAKLCLGLARVLAADAVRFLVNTGDDFEHLGLHVSPDIDTLVYTLSGAADPERGWGRRDESWQCLGALRELGEPDWFALGDRDLAMHLARSRALAAGTGLGAVTARLAGALGIDQAILPMSDDPVRTIVDTDAGELAFQHYFVRERCAPAVRGFRFAGAEQARPGPGVLEALADPGLAGIVLCPSNPFVSIDPILAVPGIRAAIAASPAPVIAVSPLVGGDAVKGPTAKMMDELAVPRTAAALAAHYGDLLDVLVLDHADAAQADAVTRLGVRADVTRTLMVDSGDRERLAERVLALVADAG